METGSQRGSIIYIGDTPDFFANGVTISFDLNLKVLGPYFDTKVISEGILPNDSLLYKMKRIRISAQKLRSELRKVPDQKALLYTNLPLSILGMIKTWIYVWCASQNDTKTVLHLHRGDFFTTFYCGFFKKWLSVKVLKRAKTLIVLSDSFQEKFNAEFPNLKLHTLHNRIESEIEMKEVNRKKHHFLFLSNYFESKGIFDLLEVFREVQGVFPHIHLDCYGRFPNEKIREQIMTYESESINIYEAISGKEKYDIIRTSSCLILPSWEEGQPLVLLEAMSQATPIIATDTGVIREMLGKKYPLICKVKDRKSLKKRIIEAIKKNNLNLLGKELKVRYKINYSIAGHKTELLRIFRTKIING